jgi:hypothetical protein
VRTLTLSLLLLLTAASRAGAQDEPKPIGPFVIDVRGSLPKFPEAAQLAQSRSLAIEELPGRGFGGDAALHVYLFQWKAVTFGIGAHATLARSHSSAGTAGGIERRGVTGRFVSFTPQLSLNFGTGDGWSYISGGIGQAQWSTTIDGQPAIPGDAERLTTINYGGGARWFAKRHLAFHVDVRFHAIYPGTPYVGRPGSPRTTMTIIGAGVSVK